MISCGNYFESPKTIELSDSSVLVMDMPQAKSYLSDIVEFRKDKETIKHLSKVGADAFLIGEYFMREDDIEASLRAVKKVD